MDFGMEERKRMEECERWSEGRLGRSLRGKDRMLIN